VGWVWCGGVLGGCCVCGVCGVLGWVVGLVWGCVVVCVLGLVCVVLGWVGVWVCGGWGGVGGVGVGGCGGGGGGEVLCLGWFQQQRCTGCTHKKTYLEAIVYTHTGIYHSTRYCKSTELRNSDHR